MKKWDKISKSELEIIVKESKSYSEIAQKCGYQVEDASGPEILEAKKLIKKYNIDDSHIRKMGWNKNGFDASIFDSKLIEKSSDLASILINLRGHKCECCGNSTWLNKKIILEVHHKDGDRRNNSQENLQLLCPNCHSMTDNWTGKNNRGRYGKVEEKDFVDALKNSSTIKEAISLLDIAYLQGNVIRAQKLIIKYNIQNQINAIEAKGILKIDSETFKVVDIFSSVSKILKDLNLKQNNNCGINKAIKNKSIYKNFFWVRENIKNIKIGDIYFKEDFKFKKFPDESKWLEALKNSSTIEEALKILNLNPYKYNLLKAQKLIDKYCINNQVGPRGDIDKRFKINP